MFLAACFSNVISLGLRDSDTDSENVSFFTRRSLSDGENLQSKGRIIDRYVINTHYYYSNLV